MLGSTRAIRLFIRDYNSSSDAIVLAFCLNELIELDAMIAQAL